jgi:hypothetical protein
MDRYDVYYKQPVSYNQFNACFDAAEQALWNMFCDRAIAGIVTGFVPSAPTTGWALNVSPGLGVDKNGGRLRSTETITLDPRTDTTGTSCVPSPGNRRWVSIFAHYGRSPNGAYLDGNQDLGLFNRPEALNPVAPYDDPANAGKLLVVRGDEDLITNPIPARPALDASAILICDILLTDGDTNLVAAKIDTSRAERMRDITLWAPPATTEYQGGFTKFTQMSAFPVYGSVIARFFISSKGPCLTLNASWDPVNRNWLADDSTQRASRLTFGLAIDGATNLVTQSRIDTTTNWLEGSGSTGWDVAYSIELDSTASSVLEPSNGDTLIAGATQTIYWAMSGQTIATGGGTVRGSAVAFPKTCPGVPSSITVATVGIADTNVNGCTFTIAPEGSGSSRWQPNGVMINVSTNGTPDVFNVRRNIIVVD